MVLSERSGKAHDDSVIDDTKLDVFVYPRDYFSGRYDIDEILQIHNGKLLLDKEGAGARLLRDAEAYVSGREAKSTAEKRMELSWCEKMLQRIDREDAEGLYRWHWLLTDSLEIYFDIADRSYLGPKKSLDELSKCDKEGFDLYKEALEFKDITSLRKWIDYLRGALDSGGRSPR